MRVILKFIRTEPNKVFNVDNSERLKFLYVYNVFCRIYRKKWKYYVNKFELVPLKMRTQERFHWLVTEFHQLSTSWGANVFVIGKLEYEFDNWLHPQINILGRCF